MYAPYDYVYIHSYQQLSTEEGRSSSVLLLRMELIMYNPNKPSQLVALISSSEAKPTMSSLEIAKLTGKEHKHVLRDIRKMFDELGLAESRFGLGYIDANNQERTSYELPYDETMILLTGYSTKLRAKVVREWSSMKEQALLEAVAHWRSLGLPASTDEHELMLQERSLKDRIDEVREVRRLEITKVQLDLLGKLRTVEAAQATALAAAANQEAAEYKRLAANAGFWLEASVSEEDIV